MPVSTTALTVHLTAVTTLENGPVAVNTLSPSATSVPAHMKLTLHGTLAGAATAVTTSVDIHTASITAAAAGDSTLAGVIAAATFIAGCAGPTLIPGRPDIQTAVIVAIGRHVANRLAPNFADACNPAEVVYVDENLLVPHADHEAAMQTAMDEFGQYATRSLGILVYNAINIATNGHSHSSARPGKLGNTTTKVCPFSRVIAVSPVNAGAILHDMYHMVPAAMFSAAARDPVWKAAMWNLAYDNLAKRLPVKGGDTALAVNYATLVKTASAYPASGLGVPVGLNEPATLTAAKTTYAAANLAGLPAATLALQACSLAVTDASAYLGGYILGKLRKTHNEEDLTMAEAASNHGMTLLKSPALVRATTQEGGAALFAMGITEGYATVTSAVVKSFTQATMNRMVASLEGIAPAAPAVAPAAVEAVTPAGAV